MGPLNDFCEAESQKRCRKPERGFCCREHRKREKDAGFSRENSARRRIKPAGPANKQKHSHQGVQQKPDRQLSEPQLRSNCMCKEKGGNFLSDINKEYEEG